MALIECIPNISEGRRQDVLEACAAAVRAAGALLLDLSHDPAHNRAVLTFAGAPDRFREAALALYDVAVARIDLRRHDGVHPRLGAVDVVPFVPLAGATMADCVAVARDVAAEVARRHQLPVYLYEAAASAPHRRALEKIRRGQFEGLATKMRLPGWAPDFGPDAPHPTAGATVVGARPPLIAFNINLASDQLDVAKAIASAVRESSGGLPFVKALGFPLADRGIVQVSMNLTNFRETSMARVFDAVSREATARGVAVLESEIVGLVPAEALAAVGAAHLRLPAFSPARLLEVQLLAGGVLAASDSTPPS
jgi:glutamate formiminotransferase / 5-formyltetrahydrofolate cyclo-ligase